MAIEHYEGLSAQGSNQAYVIAKFLKEKFLPLEKQQIKDAWDNGAYGAGEFMLNIETSQEYYNEIYGK